MSKEFNRRDFLKTASVFGLAAVYGYLGISTAIRLSPFLEISANEPVHIPIDKLASCISAPEPVPVLLETPEGTVTTRVGIDKTAFSRALIFQTQFFAPENPGKLLALLEKRPLSLKISVDKPRSFSSDGRKFLTYATYKPYVAGGPEITFYKDFINNYYRAVTQIDLATQMTNDQGVLHEIAHFLRDVEAPLAQGFASAISELQIMVEKVPFVPNYDWAKDPEEIAAQVVSRAMVDRMYEDFLLKSRDLSFWPFGKFFTFQR